MAGAEIAAPSFPPLLDGRPAPAGVDPFEAAVAAAVAEEEAGALFWSAEADLMRAAVVLAPETGRAAALAMHLAAAVALNDALGALAPAGVGFLHLWPGHVLVNGGLAGAVRSTLAPGDPPDWMTTGVALSLRFPEGVDPGRLPAHTTLFEEGCGELTAVGLLESWARHFLTWVHRWEIDGPRPVFEAWLYRAAGREEEADFRIGPAVTRGRMLGLSETGDMTLRRGAAIETLSLDAALARAEPWPPAAFRRIAPRRAS